MMRHMLGRGLPAETRRHISSCTASLSRDQPLANLKPTIQCIGIPVRSSPAYIASQTYATATKKTTTKKTTTTPRKKTTTVQTKTKKKPAAKAAAKKKPAKKPAKKAAPKRAKQPRAAPTALQAKRTKVNELRKVALLNGPKLLPANAYQVFLHEHGAQAAGANSKTIGERARSQAQSYHSLSDSEKERFASVSQQNRRANEQTTKKWIGSHTPWEVKVANNARRHLNRISKEPVPAGAKSKLVAHASLLLKDSRAPKKEDTPYIAYGRERWASGDFKDVRASDAARSISKEWNALSPDDKRKYQDVYREAQVKYAEEFERVYGPKPVKAKTTRTKKAKATS